MKILARLEQDPTISNQALADGLGLSRAQVIARLNRIEGMDIAHIVGLCDIQVGGAQLVNIFVNASGRSTDDLAEELSELPWTIAVVGLIGTEDLLVSFRLPAGRSAIEALEALAGIDGVVSTRLMLVLKIYSSRTERMIFSRRLTGDVDACKAQLREDLALADIDDLDYSLIAEFQINGRTRIRDLAQRYGLTQGAIRYRLRNLHAKKLLRLALSVDPIAIGLNCWTSLEITVAPRTIGAVIAQLRDQPWNTILAQVTGSAAIHCLTLTSGHDEVRSILDQVSQFEGVVAVAPQILTGVYKNETVWGVFPD